MSPRAIGGVAPSAVPAPTTDSLWDHWTAGFAHTAAFATARSALAALFADRRPRRLWLPAYVCQTVLDGAASVPARWYPVDGRLSFDLGGVEPGDAVLVVDYFGRAPQIAPMPGVLIVEDRAQALDAGPAFGDVVLYSPRKLVGVGDGGLLVANQALPQPDSPGDDATWAPNDARAADPDGLNPASWRPAFIAREAGLEPDGQAMSPRTMAALQGLDWRAEAAARRANWAILAAELSDHALWPERQVSFAPLAFPILADDAAALGARLADQRIWAPRHWADLPSPASFAEAQELSRRLISLPLDGRYGADDMARIVEAVRSYPL